MTKYHFLTDFVTLRFGEMPGKKRKSTAKKLAPDGRRSCPFCKKPGLLENEIPLTDEDREELIEMKHRATMNNDRKLLAKWEVCNFSLDLSLVMGNIY